MNVIKTIILVLGALVTIYEFINIIKDIFSPYDNDLWKIVLRLVGLAALGAFLFWVYKDEYTSEKVGDNTGEYVGEKTDGNIEVHSFNSQGIYKVMDSDAVPNHITEISPDTLNKVSNKYKWIRFDNAKASSELPSEYDSTTGITYYHGAENAIDGTLRYSWQEGAVGNGVDEVLTLAFNRENKIKFLALYLGNWREDKDMYNVNYIPSILDLYVNGEYVDSLHFNLEKEVHYVVFDDMVNIKEISLSIKESKPGKGDNLNADCCIAEVCAFGKAA